MPSHDCYQHIDLASDPENPSCGWASCDTHFLKCDDCGEWIIASELVEWERSSIFRHNRQQYICGGCADGRRDMDQAGIGHYEYWGIPGFQR